MIVRKKLVAALLLVVIAATTVPAAYAQPSEPEDILKYDLDSIRESWQSLPDEELNEYISNNNDTDLYDFIAGIPENEQEILLSKNTMLNNEVSIDRGNDQFDKMPYYDWIMKNGKEAKPMMFRARAVASSFTAKSGYCYYRFVDNNSGYVVKYKVNFTLDSTENAESTTNDYTIASVMTGTDGSNTNKTSLDEVTFTKQKTYMQKANSSHKELGDGTSEKSEDGKMMYRTAITPIFVLTVKVKKPAYTYGEWSADGFELVDGTKQTLASGSRFNFREYNWQNTGDSTFDAKVYHKEVTDTLTSCVNILSCGFTVDNPNSLGLAEGVPEHDTINIVYKHPVLNIDLFMNGGTVEPASSNEKGENPVKRHVLYDFAFNKKYGLPLPVNLGFKKEGYAPKAGAEWKNNDGTLTWDEENLNYTATDLKDFTDGNYFTSMERDMYVNWDAKVYKVTLDNQGATSSGTKETWYKYNTCKTVKLADGTSQTNYFYTASTLKTALNSGYKIVKPKKTGYTFRGYFTKKGGKGTQYVTASGSFTNKLWKTVGPHTLYAHWEKNTEPKGTLVIRKLLDEKDYYSSHGEATFLFKIMSADDKSKVYFRKITFDDSDLASTGNGVASQETECVLPYGSYTVTAMEVYRYENRLKSISSGNKVNSLQGKFQLKADCEEVTAVYDGLKVNWAKFSHNDAVVNSLN